MESLEFLSLEILEKNTEIVFCVMAIFFKCLPAPRIYNNNNITVIVKQLLIYNLVLNMSMHLLSYTILLILRSMYHFNHFIGEESAVQQN